MDISYISAVGGLVIGLASIGGSVLINYHNSRVTRDKMVMDFAIADWKEGKDTSWGLHQFYIYYIRYNAFINEHKEDEEISSEDFEIFNRSIANTINNSRKVRGYIDEVI